MHIRNPIEFLADAPVRSADELKPAPSGTYWPNAPETAPIVRRAHFSDIVAALRAGIEDFQANRTDVLMLALIYPIAGLVSAAAVERQSLLPFIAPLVTGFALIGPLATLWIAELSRRREQTGSASLIDALGLLKSPQRGAIAALGLIQILLLIAWIGAADGIYQATMGTAPPATFSAFLATLFGTATGLTLLLVWVGVGAVFAIVALAVGAVSFPLLLDRPVTLGAAIRVSATALLVNPHVLFAWGGIVVAGLLLGAVPALLGLCVVLPVLGHATWHLYRRLVA